ncbi:hypothetical protein GF373_05020, partial [bacterium]|nr:hypothetical protein [bacterium]
MSSEGSSKFYCKKSSRGFRFFRSIRMRLSNAKPRCNMKSFFLSRLTILGCLVLLLVSCSVHQVKQEIQPPAQIPKDYSYTGAMKLPDNRWWEAFEAEPLSRLIEQMVSGNLHIKAAWARLDQMAAMAQQSGALLYPQLNFEGRLSRSKNEFSSFGRNATGYSTQIPLSLNLSYEVDLWDRIQSQREAALLDFEANAELLQSTVLLLASQVTGLWINIH